jgi:hypothetical protein
LRKPQYRPRGMSAKVWAEEAKTSPHHESLRSCASDLEGVYAGR